ncbi:MAG: hypothetical protein EXS41_00080 [Opitutaceae bacterium]|nr:hypothetical protein [Opitutaceae bacterium]
MRWILEHLQICLALAGAIAYWLTQQKAADSRGAPKDAAPLLRPEGEDAERTRRIQEEIRRKIAGRRGGAQPPVFTPATPGRPLASPVLAPRPVAGGGLREKLESKLAQARAREAARDAARARQQQLEAQLRKLETERLAADRKAAEVFLVARAETKASAVAENTADVLAARGSRAWLDELRDPRNARRAIVLREVLGEPVGFR